MKPSDILNQLSTDHAELRTLIREARASLKEDQPPQSPASQVDRMRGWIANLLDKVGAHNRREEHLIQEVLPTLGAWDGVRAQFVSHEHAREHRQLYDAFDRLRLSGGSPDSFPIETLFDALLAHMDHEEQLFVRPEVLRDT